MNKYFDTLDVVHNLVKNRPFSQRLRAYENALRLEHDVGPEANYIIKLWNDSPKNDMDRRKN